jgi:ferritin
MDKRLVAQIEEQINHEISNWYIYKNFSGIADKLSLLGAVSWFDKQAMEEYSHFDRFYTFLSDMGYVPTLKDITAPPPEVTTLTELFAMALMVEKKTSAMLQGLFDLATMLKEGKAVDLVEQFLKEQVEEEKSVSDILNRLKIAGEGYGTILIDQELAKR